MFRSFYDFVSVVEFIGSCSGPPLASAGMGAAQSADVSEHCPTLPSDQLIQGAAQTALAEDASTAIAARRQSPQRGKPRGQGHRL